MDVSIKNNHRVTRYGGEGEEPPPHHQTLGSPMDACPPPIKKYLSPPLWSHLSTPYQKNDGGV